jgi:prolyl-tRNA editing enzyme YbaK/EbsC (Cys-tRNA(Pro) deacylase)
MPPIGEPYGLPVYADRAIHDDPDITFHAASHHFTVHVDRPAWERAVGVVYADLARDREAAWDR